MHLLRTALGRLFSTIFELFIHFRYAVVRHEFVGRQKDELSVRIGDSIRVVRMANNDWVECRDPATDAVGIVPLSFLELYLDEDDEEVKKTTDAGFANFGSQPFSPGSVGNLSDWRNSTSRSEDSGSSPSSFHPSKFTLRRKQLVFPHFSSCTCLTENNKKDGGFQMPIIPAGLHLVMTG